MSVSRLNGLPLRILKNALAAVLQSLVVVPWLKGNCGWRYSWKRKLVEKDPNTFRYPYCCGFVFLKFSDLSLIAFFSPLVYVNFIRSPPIYKSGISIHNLHCQLLWVKSIPVTELSCFCLCSNFQITITIISLKQADPLHFLCSYNPTLS